MPDKVTSPDERDKHIHQWACPGIHNKKEPDKYWICLNPSCFAKAKKRALINKLSTCASCGAHTLILDSQKLKTAYPKCENCSQSKEAIEKRKVKETAKNLFTDLMGEIEEVVK